MSWMMLIVIWSWACCVSSITQLTPEEVELFSSVKQNKLEWTSEPQNAWSEKRLKAELRVYQACLAGSQSRSLLTKWMDGRDARRLLLDVTFAQEEERSDGRLTPLQIHLLESDAPLSRFRVGQKVVELTASRPLPVSTTGDPGEYFSRRLGVDLGKLSRRGFHLGFSYSGACVLLSSVRLYYRRCPALTSDLVRFDGAPAGSGRRAGACEEGAAEEEGSAPERECLVEGVWGPLIGGCVCAPGHQRVGDACEACRAGYYKPANESGGCRPCSPNSGTGGEGAAACACVPGFFRLPADPDHIGCTQPPSAPVNLAVRVLNASMLSLRWDPPLRTGGRRELAFDVACLEAEGGAAGGASARCGERVVILPTATGLTTTEVNVTGVDPRSDYTLSVRAWNAVSAHQEEPASSVASVFIHHRKSAVVTPPVPARPDARPQRGLFPWWLVGGTCGGLLLLALVFALLLRYRNTRLSGKNDVVELLPIQSGVTYRRQDDSSTAPQESPAVPGAVQLLEGLSDRRLLTVLRDVMVERSALTLGKELGKGQFGAVYEGIFSPEEGTDIKVAVKTMRVGIHSQEDLEEFLKEAEIMRHFNHDNVVKLLGVTVELEQDAALPVPLMIMPFMKHGDLRRFLIATRYGDIPMFVPYQSLLRFMIDIAAGMDYLSARGFLHRDLAARNCMLGDDLRVCVADFGLSKKIYSNNYYRQKVSVSMPVKWMAIESLSESVYTSKTDVWSFGVTVWEIVSRGRTPYPGVHNHELLEFLEKGHRLKQPGCDDKLYEVMQSCWRRDPAQRPGFTALGETLRALLSDLPPLEAGQEACYINQGLEAAYRGGGACGRDPELEEEDAAGNIYLPGPVEAQPTLRVEDEEEEEGGYLRSILPGSALKMVD